MYPRHGITQCVVGPPFIASQDVIHPRKAGASIGADIENTLFGTYPIDSGGDRELSYDLLVKQHGVGVFRLMYAIVGDSATAEDLTQDAFLRAYEHWHQLKSPEGARGWLFTIAANMARQHLRRERRWSWLPLERLDGIRSDELGDAEILVFNSVSPILDKLKSEDRSVLALMGLLEFTARETAAVLGIRQAAVHKRWQRACARFRDIHGLESSHEM